LGETAPPRGRVITVAIAVVLAAVLLYYSLHGIEWREVARTVRRADARLLALTASTAVSTIVLRAWRWRILLNAEARVGAAAVFWATAAGLFGNSFLPARAGELVRTFMISAEFRLAKAYVLATAIAERIADAIVLVTIAALVLLTMASPPGWLSAAARPFAVLGLAGAAAIAVLPLLGPAGERLIARAPLPHAAQARLIALMEQGLRGLRAFHDAGRLFAFIAIAVVIWIIDAIGTVIGGAALGLTIPLPVAFLLNAGLGLGSALPSTPGYIGIYQFVTVSVMTPFGFSRADAIAYILVSQALMYVVIGMLGAIGLLRRRKLA
jgi:glycosyltransferase 2 family protein